MKIAAIYKMDVVEKNIFRKTLVQYITSCDVKTTPAPDHRAVIINIRKHKLVRGPPYWKLNDSILNEDEYQSGIIEIFK